ncbi:hypothetical protein NFI96_003009 [Prochilodus magdalenae]|nr:hypothetical protein NFI96_003009 [Prochilodus magdalenae]
MRVVKCLSDLVLLHVLLIFCVKRLHPNTRVRLQEEAAAAVGLKMGHSAISVWTRPLLLLLLVLTDLAQCCPRPCACPQPREVHCTFRSLLTMPAGVPKQVERMNLGFNSINRITPSSFAGMRKLELLMMHGNDVHNIPDGAFRDLVSLQMMKMSYNKLKVISRRTFQGLWSLARLHLDHNRLEFIHPDAFQVSTLKNLHLSENGLTTLPQKMLAGMPHLENLFLHDNPWSCDCRMKWFKDWSKSTAGVLKCKKDRALAGGQLCPMCSSPKRLQKKDLQELDDPTCSGPIISNPHRTSSSDTESELISLAEFRQPLGNISLELSDEHGNKVDLRCHVNEPTESTRINWDHVNQHQISTNVSLRLDLECPIDRANYERLWRLIAYYSDVPAHLQREMMLSKDPHISYRYRQDVEKDALYYTGVKVNIKAEPAWVMQPSLDLQLNRPQSTSKRVRLVLSSHITQLVEAEEVRQHKRTWVLIESRNSTRISQAAVVGSPVEMHCNVHSSGNPVIKWSLPDGSKVEAPYQSSDKHITVDPSGFLDIRAVDHSDSGVYYCIASVVDDISVLAFRLTVEESSNPPPGGEGVAEPVAGVAGGPVSLPCLASGSPDPDINWILPDSSVINSLSNSSKVLLASNGTLTIRFSHLSDNGYYKCVAGNQHGADTLATKVTLTRPAGGMPMRKYSSRPQPAEGVSTKIKAPMDNDVEASGDNENGKPEEKASPGQGDTPKRRRIPNVSVQTGHPSRKSWRRPAMPRRRIASPGADRTNTVERRRINVSNSQIDPKRWANILAKVRGGGSSPKTTTPSSVQTSTHILRESDTAHTKKSGSPERTEGSSEDGTTIPPPQEAHTVTGSGMPAQTTEISLDIRPLGSGDQTHITYQIAAPEINPDSDVFTSSTYVLQTTIGPEPTQTATEKDMAKWFDLSTVGSPASYGSLFQDSQSHTTVGSQVTATMPRSEGGDDGNVADDDEFSISNSLRNGGEFYQEEADHSPILTTAVAFEDQSTEKHVDARSFTEPTTTAAQQATQELQKLSTPEKHGVAEIPLLTTAAPTNEATLENKGGRGKHIISANPAPSSRARNSSNSKPRKGGRRRRPNRNKTRSKSSKSSAHVTNVTPQPTTSASVSEVTKTTASSQSEIETSAGAMSTGAKVDTTVPFTDSQATSLSKMTHEKNTVPLYNGRNNISPDSSLQEKVSEVKETPSAYAKHSHTSMSTTMVSAPQSDSLGYTGHRETEINTETVTTLSPLVHNALSTTAEKEGFTSIRPPAVTAFEEAETESATGHTADTFLESPHVQPEAIPGAASDKAGDQYKPSDAENVPPSSELARDFPLRPFSSSAPSNKHEITESHDSEIPSGSTKANLYESPQVTTEGPATSQSAQGSELTTITTLSRASTDGDWEEATAQFEKPVEENEYLKEDGIPVPTITNAIVTSAMTEPSSTPSEIFPATTRAPPPLPTTTTPTPTPPPTTTTKTVRPSQGPPHVSFQNRPEGKTVIPDSTNHIPDRHNKGAAITEPKIIIRPALNSAPDRLRPSVSHSVGQSEDTKPDTNILLSTTEPKSQSTVKQAPTASPEFPVPSLPKLTIPGRSNTQSRGASTLHHAASGGVHQTAVVAARRGQPRITSTDINTVTAQAESDAYLPCVAVGEPSPFLSWTKVSTGASIAQNSKIQRFEVHHNGTLIIRNVLPLDQGQYLCNIQNQYGEDRKVVTLVVLAERPLMLQPRHRDTTAYLGDTVELECQSQGQPPPRTTWVLPDRAMIHMEAPSPGSPEQRVSVLANGTLRILSATYADRGVYQCIATNAAGADTVSVRLTVTASLPVIQQLRHENVSLPAGITAYINCSATGSPSPTISWTTPDGLRLWPSQFVSGRNLFVFPNGTLYIRGLGQADAGKYECTATSAVGSSSRAVRLSVKNTIASARARITSSSPQKTDVTYGGRLQLDCVASGDPEPRVIWRTPSKKLVDAHYSYDPRIKVFANGSLTMHSVTEKDEGNYLCVARNKMGDDYVPLKVNVLTKPAKIEQRNQANQKVTYGEDLKVDCVASGLPNPKIQWALPDGTMINSIMKSDSSGGGRSRRYVVFDNGTLFFNDVGIHEEGDYTCYAENQIGKDEMKVHVRVVAEVPVIRNKTFEVVRVMYGESVSLRCSAKGEPNPVILWFSPTTRAIPSASDKYTIHNDGTLVIQNVQRFDGGNYTCLARNSAGQDRKVSRLEILVSSPAINGLRGSTNFLKVSAVRDQRRLIHCEATGIPVPRVMWVLPENIVLPSPYYGSRMTVHRNGTLDIRSLRATDAAQLTCIARNEGGEARLIVQLDVTDVIEKPRLRGPQTESLTLTVGRSMTLNCSFEGSPAPQISWILPGGAPIMAGSQFNKFLLKPDGTLVINNPALSEAGTYRCLGRNSGGVVERTVVLMPGRKPEINNKYNSPISVVNGENLLLHCLSTTEPVRLTWTLPSGVVLNRPQRAGRYAVLPNGTLSIHQASVYDRGSYTCSAANEYGSSLLAIQVIIIAYPPRITSGPAPSTYARRGVAVQLNCAAVGIPKAEVAWETPDRTRLVANPQPRIFGNKYLHPQGSLIIQNPMPKDAGFYRCTARNVMGVDSKGSKDEKKPVTVLSRLEGSLTDDSTGRLLEGSPTKNAPWGTFHNWVNWQQDPHRAGIMWVVGHSQHCSDTGLVLVCVVLVCTVRDDGSSAAAQCSVGHPLGLNQCSQDAVYRC